MSVDLRAAAAEHLAQRRARGYRLADHGWLLGSFLDGLHARGHTTITVADAVAFAQARPATGRIWKATRLRAVRGLAAHVHALDPAAAELIPAGLIPANLTRRVPYLYSDEQITTLMSGAAALSPALLAASMHTLIGLLAVTGMRSGEAVALDVQNLDANRRVLAVTGKYGKRRIVPLHHTTLEALAHYRQAHATAAPPTGALLLGAKGGRLRPDRARAAFRAVADACDLRARPGCGPPRLHDFRHTFAVNSLLDAHRQGVDVDARIAALATFLGHVQPAHTYWYLTASPELMALVSDRVAAYQRGRRP
jgi:integrase